MRSRRRRASRVCRWLVSSVAAAVLLSACGSSSPSGQQVTLIAGGGTSTADSASATSLRMPGHVTAMTTGPDGTLWLAAEDGNDAAQLISVAHDGAARRIHLPSGRRTPTSLAVVGGTLYAADQDTVIWRLAGTSLVPEFGSPSPVAAKPQAVTGPFVPDGGRLAAGHLGIVGALAADSSGGLLFVESPDFCGRLRRVGADGTVHTIAGIACPQTLQTADYVEARFPKAGVTADQLRVIATSTIAATPNGDIYLGTDRSVLRLSGSAVALVSAVTTGSGEDLPEVPVGDKPLSAHAALSKVGVWPPTAGAGTSLAVGPDGSLAVRAQQAATQFKPAFTWQIDQDGTKLSVSPPDRGQAVVLIARDGTATTASAVGSNIAFRGADLLVSASRNDASFVVQVPAR